MKMDIHRHGLRPMPSSCKNLNPPNFSLPYTFNKKEFYNYHNCFQKFCFSLSYNSVAFCNPDSWFLSARSFFLRKTYFYVSEVYLTHFSYPRWFLNYPVQRGRRAREGRGSALSTQWGKAIGKGSVQYKYRIQNTAAAKWMYSYIQLPMYLFFYMALGLNDFHGGKSINGAIGRGGPNKNFFAPKWHEQILRPAT